MKYFFPNPFIGNETDLPTRKGLEYTVNSGKNALRLALKSFELPFNSTIGIPSFCCNAVQTSVIQEGFTPYFFDLKKEQSYWADYNQEQLLSNDIKAIILVHLYGFIHPDSKEIIKFCRVNNIKIVHDAAQSFGIDTSFFEDDLIIYSFGPGKSTTAALGGEIVNLKHFPVNTISAPKLIHKINARIFFNSRLMRFKHKKTNTFLGHIFNKYDKENINFTDMSVFQKKRAIQVKEIVAGSKQERKERYVFLINSIKHNKSILSAFDDGNGLYFKLVLFIPENMDGFIQYLDNNRIPFYRLAVDIDLKSRNKEMLPKFFKNYSNFIEVSTERSISMEEIRRIANVLSKFN